MAFKFNPLTGQFDIDTQSAGGGGTDFHSGYYEIQNAQTVTIEEFKQSVTFGTLVNDGTLNVDGQLILET